MADDKASYLMEDENMGKKMDEKDENAAHEVGVRLREPELAFMEELICKLMALALESKDVLKSIAYIIASKVLYEEVRREQNK